MGLFSFGDDRKEFVMTNNIKKLFSLLLALAIVAGMVPVRAEAVSTENIGLQETVTVEFVQIPILETEEFLQEDAAAEALRRQMQQRNEIIDIKVRSNDANYEQVLFRIMDKACAHSGDPTAGDYLYWHRSGYRGYIAKDFIDGTYYYIFRYEMYYITTAQQEAELTAAVDALLAQLALTNKSDYEKICGIYDYMTHNITYDYENLEDETYVLKYSAYAALINKTAVCQGYASLFYRLALELGVDCRLIAGIGYGGAHGWNIVKLDGKYYNVDATWDSDWVKLGLDYNYFLRCEDNFGDHIRDEEYNTPQFHAEYPMDSADYVPKPAIEYGDANGDGFVNGTDATLLLQYAAGWNVEINMVAADANCDGLVNGNDATLLLQYAAGWDVTLGAA